MDGAGAGNARRGAQCFTEHLQALEAELRQALAAVAEQTAQFQPSATDSEMGGREKRKSYVGRMFSGRQNARNNQRRLLECRLRLSRVVLNHVVNLPEKTSPYFVQPSISWTTNPTAALMRARRSGITS